MILDPNNDDADGLVVGQSRETASEFLAGLEGRPPTGDDVGGLDHGALADGFRATDVGNADRLVAAADGRIRYVHAWGRWIVYHDGRWIIDTADTLVTEAAKQVPRAMFARAANLSGDARDDLWKWAKRSETATRVAAMIRLARGIDGVLVEHTDLDRNPWLLNVTNGTIDLRTGELRDHDPDDLLTMQAPVRFDQDADAPLWRKCVEQWQPDPEVRAYLQRACGSGITGHPLEHFFVNLGEGANGKGKFFGALARVLGDYYVVPHKSLLVVQRHDQHDTVKADLFRTRMAVCAETEQGARLDESKIKDLTGGDPLRARRMREDPWPFLPTWTMFLHTNYRPHVRGTDEGIWRRTRLIPWTVTIPAAERDDQLADKLAAETSGILNWLIHGCLEWQRHGLADPEQVTTATASWRGDEDIIGRWLADCTIKGESYAATARSLHESHEQWSAANGERPLSAKALGMELDRRGYDSARERRQRVWVGLGLLTADEEASA